MIVIGLLIGGVFVFALLSDAGQPLLGAIIGGGMALASWWLFYNFEP